LVTAPAPERLALDPKSGDFLQSVPAVPAGAAGRGFVMSGWARRRLFPVMFAVCAPLLASAQSHGPDTWAVTGVKSNDALNLRVAPNADSRAIGRIPYNARGVRNFGCPNDVTFEQWLRMTQAQRDKAQRSRWCQVEYNGQKGWVAGRFLKEDAAPPAAKGVGLAPAAK
jgi:hypothetical protein